MNDISQAAAIMGAKGGKAGTGASKARTYEQCYAAYLKARETIAIPMPQRFWRHVEPEDGDRCRNWTGRMIPAGYGGFKFHSKILTASRMAWELTNGEIPHGLHVLHKCDNRACCNPKHLFLGTHDDNMKDAMRKGRTYRALGAQNSRAKLSATQVREIRSKYIPHIYTITMLCNEYSVSRPTIKRVIYRKSYKHD